MPKWFPEILVGLLPVLLFLAALVTLDSYKLVKLRSVIAAVAAGAAAAFASYFANAYAMQATGLDFTNFSRYLAPFIEELLKGLIIVMLIRFGRIGFLVDAAIFGFAVGAGFSMLENVYYLIFHVAQDAGIGTWIIRGLGTAIMHGGATSIFAVACVNFLDHPSARGAAGLVPGFALAVAVHALYNHAFLPPIFQTFVVLITVPALLALVFRQSEKALGAWLGSGFDADAQLLELLNSGQLSDAPLGRYLTTLKKKFKGPIVADILCYIRLYTELALRAKGLLMMREAGFEPPIDQATRDKFTELQYVEASIGRMGQMAIRPMLHFSRKDLWQLYLLKE